jgi:hypothetical protein
MGLINKNTREPKNNKTNDNLILKHWVGNFARSRYAVRVPSPIL